MAHIFLMLEQTLRCTCRKMTAPTLAAHTAPLGSFVTEQTPAKLARRVFTLRRPLLAAWRAMEGNTWFLLERVSVCRVNSGSTRDRLVLLQRRIVAFVTLGPTLQLLDRKRAQSALLASTCLTPQRQQRCTFQRPIALRAKKEDT
jgi:hypothetical protein